MGKCDFVVDWGVGPDVGPDAAGFNSALYPDGIHPGQAGQNNIEALYFRPKLKFLSQQHFVIVIQNGHAQVAL